MADAKATSLPYGKDTFIKASDRLYQHRSIADAIRRKSPSMFNSKTVAAWKSQPDWGPAVGKPCFNHEMLAKRELLEDKSILD